MLHDLVSEEDEMGRKSHGRHVADRNSRILSRAPQKLPRCHVRKTGTTPVLLLHVFPHPPSLIPFCLSCCFCTPPDADSRVQGEEFAAYMTLLTSKRTREADSAVMICPKRHFSCLYPTASEAGKGLWR